MILVALREPTLKGVLPSQEEIPMLSVPKTASRVLSIVMPAQQVFASRKWMMGTTI